MPKSFNAPAAVNPHTAGWANTFISRDDDDLKVHTDPTVRHLGVCTSAEDRLGGAVGVALAGEEALLKIGTAIDVSGASGGLITTDAAGKGQPAAAPNRAMAILAQQSDAAADRLVAVRVLDGLTPLA